MRFLLDQGDGGDRDSLGGRVVWGPRDPGGGFSYPLAMSSEGVIIRGDEIPPGEHCFTISREIHEWLVAHGVDYTLAWDTWSDRSAIRDGYSRVWVIDLRCRRDIAALFKLTWL